MTGHLHKIEHFGFRFFLGGFCACKTARTASSNTFLSPFCVKAEHSTYLTAPISFISLCPKAGDTEKGRLLSSGSNISISSRRSSFVPTRTMGVLGQWWVTSGCHLALTLLRWNGSKERPEDCSTPIYIVNGRIVFLSFSFTIVL